MAVPFVMSQTVNGPKFINRKMNKKAGVSIIATPYTNKAESSAATCVITSRSHSMKLRDVRHQ